MSRRNGLDAVIAGGGVVGAACALLLARAGQKVALVDPRAPVAWQREVRDLRVFAIAPDNAALLEQLGVWEAITRARVQAYRRMQVWDAGGGAPLVFDADTLAQPQLGWIIENNLLIDRLWQALREANVRLYCPAKIETLEQDESGVRLGLDDGISLEAGLVVAADGAQSKLRQLAGIAVSTHDYEQRGVVAFVRSEHPHQASCWQRFLPTGPVALLPFNDDGEAALQGRLGSIVWTLPNAEAQRLLDAPEEQFKRELAHAFGGELGALQLQSSRAAFPLRRQLAKTQYKQRLLLVGDAAHAVHPLAGQGVNLGLRDVAGLQTLLRTGRTLSSAQLARWARTRRSDNALGAYSFEAINCAFSNDALLPSLLRGHALGLAGRLLPLQRLLWQHSNGGGIHAPKATEKA